MRELRGLQPCWTAIEIEGRQQGAALILKGRKQAFRIDRGPFWFTENVPETWHRAFWQALSRARPRRFLSPRRVMPEWPEGPDGRPVIAGWRALRKSRPYATLWLDLQDRALETGLHTKWRADLNRARSDENLVCTTDEKGGYLVRLLRLYQADKGLRNYGGPELNFIRPLASRYFTAQSALISAVTDREKGDVLAAALFLIHGSSATYQIGVTVAEGRRCGAGHRALWDGILALRVRNVLSLDLGGLPPEGEAEGLARFKRRMGGEEIKLIGSYA